MGKDRFGEGRAMRREPLSLKPRRRFARGGVSHAEPSESEHPSHGEALAATHSFGRRAEGPAGVVLRQEHDEERGLSNACAVFSLVSHTPIPPTHTRTNVFPDGATSVESDTLGLVRSRTGQVAATGMTKRYPAVFELFCRWLRENQPVIFEHPFACTSISVNHGYAARRHRCV